MEVPVNIFLICMDEYIYVLICGLFLFLLYLLILVS